MEEHLPTILSALTLLAIVLGFLDRVFKKGKSESNIEDRVSSLERTVDKTSKDIDTIKTNHLAHIQSDINRININLAEINTTLKIKFEEE